MKLREYLEQISGETQAVFAKRAGLSQSAVAFICQDRGTHTSSAVKVVKATDGLVSFEELTGEGEQGAA